MSRYTIIYLSTIAVTCFLIWVVWRSKKSKGTKNIWTIVLAILAVLIINETNSMKAQFRFRLADGSLHDRKDIYNACVDTWGIPEEYGKEFCSCFADKIVANKHLLTEEQIFVLRRKQGETDADAIARISSDTVVLPLFIECGEQVASGTNGIK